MPTARTMAQVEKMIMDRIQIAVKQSVPAAEEQMKIALYDYYNSGTPVWYKRTYQMRDSRDVSPISTGKNFCSFEYYLDTNGKYDTGAEPTYEEAFLLADRNIKFETSPGRYAHPTVGTGSFWMMAVTRTEHEVRNIFRGHFK